ncbi:hypothetical protein [Duncaniella freteri]|uniref:hypothetical protein n=1 Tax=Duncaniella freteri TaxID=2530391 RepID=UPI003F66781A
MAQTVIPLRRTQHPTPALSVFTEEQNYTPTFKGHEKDGLTAYLLNLPAPFDKKFKGN